MRHFRITLGAAAALLVLIAALVLLRQRTGQAGDQAVSGEIVRYDESTRVLTLRTDGGDGGFVVPASTAVHQGVKRLPVSALPSAVGHRAKVWYRDADGRRTASQIRVAIPYSTEASTR